MRHILWAGLTAAALAGCAETPALPSLAAIETNLETNWTYDALETSAYRGYAASYSEMPFANGAMSIVSADHGEMHTFRLVPCGETVCAGSAHGPRGRVEATADYLIVSGLYRRTFWLSPGGDGAVVRADGATVPLAWDSIDSPR